MTHYFNKVCQAFLNDYFGENISKVGLFLLSNGGNHRFLDIRIQTGLSVEEVKKSLAVMINFNLVKFESSDRNRNIPLYSVIPDNVYCLLRYPMYQIIIKKKFGIFDETVIAILLELGKSSASNTIFHSAKRLKEHGDAKLSDVFAHHQSFQRLAEEKFIIRCPKLTEGNIAVQKVPKMEIEQHLRFSVPQLDIESVAKLVEGNAIKLGDHLDNNIKWRVNKERFDAELRNILLVNAARNKLEDDNAGKLYQEFLKVWRESNHEPVSSQTIKDAVSKFEESSPVLIKHFDEYLNVLCSDSCCFMTKVGDVDGLKFTVNIVRLFQSLACATLNSIIEQKFGLKALRIFRMLLDKSMKMADIVRYSMLPANEVTLLTFNLMKQNFVTIDQVTNLFGVDFCQVVRAQLECSYKGMYNCMERKRHQQTHNKSLLCRFDRLQGLREHGVFENDIIESSDTKISNAEKDLVKKLKSSEDKLMIAVTEVDETIIVFEGYVKCYIDYLGSQLPSTHE